MSSISSRMRFLINFIKVPPSAWDFIFPHGPKLSNALVEYMIAGVVRDIAQEMPNKELSQRVHRAGRQMADFAAANLVNGWEDGDDICPPWPFPFPFPSPNPDPNPWFSDRFSDLNPQPLPPRKIVSVLKVLSGLTSIKEVADQLNKVSSQLAAPRPVG